MEKNDRMLEENVARLLQAGYPAQALPDAGERQRCLRRLAALQPEREFPRWALGLLALTLVLAALWLAGQALGNDGAWGNETPFLLLAGVWLASNLAALPLAAIWIVKRRRYG